MGSDVVEMASTEVTDEVDVAAVKLMLPAPGLLL